MLTLSVCLSHSLSLSVSVCLSHPLSVSLISVCVCLSGALLEEEAADGSPALFAACASLALAPLPLILSDKSEKSLCGTGAMPAIQRWHRRCSRWAATQRRSRAPPRARSIVVARCVPLCLPLSVSAFVSLSLSHVLFLRRRCSSLLSAGTLAARRCAAAAWSRVDSSLAPSAYLSHSLCLSVSLSLSVRCCCSMGWRVLTHRPGTCSAS